MRIKKVQFAKLFGYFDYSTLGSKGHLFEQFSGEKMRKI